MAVKKLKVKAEEPVAVEVKPKAKSEKWVTVGWMLLLIAGLGHMMPTQLKPVLDFAVYGISVQMVVGVLSVIAALYYLLEE